MSSTPQLLFVSSGDVNAVGNRADFTNFLQQGSIELDYEKKYEIALAEITFPHPGLHRVFIQMPGIVPLSPVGSGTANIIYIAAPIDAPGFVSIDVSQYWWIQVAASEISTVRLRLTYLLDQEIPAAGDAAHDFTSATLFIREVGN